MGSCCVIVGCWCVSVGCWYVVGCLWCYIVGCLWCLQNDYGCGGDNFGSNSNSTFLSQIFDALLSELEPACLAEQEFIEKFFHMPLPKDDSEVYVNYIRLVRRHGIKCVTALVLNWPMMKGSILTLSNVYSTSSSVLSDLKHESCEFFKRLQKRPIS